MEGVARVLRTTRFFIQHETVNNAVKMTNILGDEVFDDITQYEVTDLINVHSETLADEYLLEITKSANEDEE